MKWTLDPRGRWLKGDAASSKSAPAALLRPNERIAPIVGIAKDAGAYVSRIGDEVGWDQALTAQLFSSVLVVGCNWVALVEILTDAARKRVFRSRVETEPGDGAVYRIVDEEEPAPRAPLFGVCQVKERYYNVIKKLTGEKVKYDLKADMARRETLTERLEVNSRVKENETRMRENIYVLQQLARKLKAGNATTASATVACLHPQLTFPPVSEARNVPLADADTLDEELEALSSLRDAQQLGSTADLIIAQMNSKVLACSQLVKHVEDSVLTNFYPPANAQKAAAAQHHYPHGKEYQEAIVRVLKKARDSPEVAAGVKTQDGETITPAQYFTTDRFAPFVHTVNSFKAYSETVECACVLANLQKQLKALETMHSQWLDKLMDVRKNARVSTKKKRTQ